jgi:hypothetical protein
VVTRLHSCLVLWRAGRAATGRFHGERLRIAMPEVHR